MEAKNVYNRICFNSPIFSPANLTSLCGANYTGNNASACSSLGPTLPMQRPRFPPYVCPSAPRASNPFLETSSISTQTCGAIPQYWAGASDYTAVSCFCNGLSCVYDQLAPNCPQGSRSHQSGQDAGDRRLGVLTFNAFRLEHFPISIERITDGTSQTIFTGELAGRPDLWQRGVKKIAKSQACGGNLFTCAPRAPGGRTLSSSTRIPAAVGPASIMPGIFNGARRLTEQISHPASAEHVRHQLLQ